MNKRRMLQPHVLALLTLLLASYLQSTMADYSPVLPYTDCRITMKEPRGVITTPNFPNPYPVPINCQWVIEAPADKVIAVYFTQFYMREGLKATEYAYYSHKVKMGKTEFGTISSEREPTYLVSNKPVLVLDFAVREMSNIHMRVREFLLDVFGFNITYEMIARNESVRKDACLYHHCSFTGNCFASSVFDRYYCNCFAKYFGDECQYDLDCGPTAGKNMCQNGGTCRYYIGSTVRTCECPPGYDGARCEKKKAGKTQVVVGSTGAECNTSCPTGETSTTAKKTEKHRYILSLKLTNPKASNIISDKKKKLNFKKEMERDLQLLFKARLEVSENITVLEFRSDSVMKFHMLATDKDMEELKSTIEGMLKLGKLGIFDFDQDFFEMDIEPALNIDMIEASEKMPIVEGQELTLACIVKGSDSLQVEWMKDGVPVYVHTTQRGMWTTVVPKNSQQQYTAILGFDRVVSLDSGTFTCRINDWDFVQNQSINIEVQSSPQPQLNPMSASIFREDQLVITCLSKEDVYGTFGYTWLKNGQIINPSNEPEMIEDLFPAGSRVLLRAAKSSATYTCIITSSAGSTRKDSVITVLDRDRSIPTCSAQEYMKIRWMLAASNTEDRQLCPVGYTGDVSRRCSLSNSRGAFWEEPDFSGCFSSSFLSIKKKVDSLRLGYLLTDVTTLLFKVKKYLLTKKPRLHVCEGEPVIDLLEDIHKIEHAERHSKEGWQAFLDIISMLLESPHLIKKHPKIIQLHEQVFKYAFEYAESTNEVGFESFKRKYIVVEIGKIPNGGDRTMKFPIQRFSRAAKYTEESPDLSPWTLNSVEFDLIRSPYDDVVEGNSTGIVTVVFYKNLSPYLPQRFVSKSGLADVEYQLISSLVEVRISGQSLQEAGRINVKVQLASFNYTSEKHNGWNISCAMADFSRGRIEFVTTGCQLVWTTKNITMCNCHNLGTYALLLTQYSRPKEVHVRRGFEIIAGAGCAVCAFFLLITILLLVSAWRKLRGAVIAFKLQVCVALLGAYITFFFGLNYSLSEVFYPYMVTVIQFFLLTSFSLQLCLALIVYIESIDLRNIHYSAGKIAAMGWTVPVIILGATLSAQSLEGFRLKGWWLNLRSTFFYAYTSSILILTMFQVLLILTVKSEIKYHGKVADFLQKKKIRVNSSRMKLLHRSLLLTATLLLVSVASILYVNFENRFFKYFFATSSAWLGFIVFLTYTFCSENHFILCCSEESLSEGIEHENSSIPSRNNSFKSFLKPELIDDAYSSKLNLDAEKRNERIRRMYSQIERSSLVKAGVDSFHSPCIEAATELLSHQQRVTASHHQQPDISLEASQRPLVLSEGSATSSPSMLTKESVDAFCNLQQDSSAYPRMQWRYATHPHGYNGSPIDQSRHNVQRPLLLDSESDPCSSIGYEEYMSHSHRQDLPQSTFQHPQTVQADVVASSEKSQNLAFLDVIDTQGSSDVLDDRNSCFAHHTDSLETVVYCEDIGNGGDDGKHPPSWNMTSV